MHHNTARKGPSHKHVGKMHKNLVKTDKQTDRWSSQYFGSPTMGEVINTHGMKRTIKHNIYNYKAATANKCYSNSDRINTNKLTD